VISLWLTLVLTQNLFADVQATLSKAPLVSGSFTQDKSVKGFKKPLKSSGDFEVMRGQRIVWHTKAPFDSTLIVTPESLTQTSAAGPSVRVSASEQPGVTMLTRVLLGVVSGDLGPLESNWTATGVVEQGRFSIQLIPKNDALKKVISELSLTGDTFVRTVRIKDGGGAETQIALLPHE
jgi:hypothetical protein